MTQEELLRYCGNPDQLWGVEPMTLASGEARGESLYRVRTAAGLEADVLADHAMDLGRVTYKGHNVCWLGKCGYTSRFEPWENGVRLSFSGGLLYTCGLRNAGPDCRDGDEWHPMHGRIHNIRAQETGAWCEDGFLRLRGRMRENAFFGHQLELERHITVPALGSEIIIEDTLRNLTPHSAEYMLLYHCNFGYPLLSPDAKLILPDRRTTIPRDRDAQAGLGSETCFCPPRDDWREQVFFHTDMDPAVRLENPALGIAAELTWSCETLPVLVEWKSMASTDYALGLEPGNTFIRGRNSERAEGGLPTLPPFAQQRMRLRIAFSTL